MGPRKANFSLGFGIKNFNLKVGGITSHKISVEIFNKLKMDLIKNFLTMQNNVRMYHWTTPIYNQHIISGELYEKLDGLFDKFIETYLGKFDKNNLQFDTLSIEMNSENILKQLIILGM